MLDMSKVQGTK